LKRKQILDFVGATVNRHTAVLTF